MFDRYVRPLPTITLDATNAGVDAPSKLYSGFRLHHLVARIRGTETLALGPATALRNAGSPWARIDALRLDEAGAERWNISGMEARFLSEMIAPAALPRGQRLATFANGAVNLEESLILPASFSLSVDPNESVWVERNAKNATNLTARWNSAAGGAAGQNPLASTPGTVTPSAYTIQIEQVFDDAKEIDKVSGGARLRRPIFLPRYRVLVQQVTVANTELPIEILTDKFLRGILIHQTTNVGDVDDIITSLALVSDDRELIGRMTNFEDLARGHIPQEFAGSLYTFGFTAAAQPAQPDLHCYLPILFQRHGRLARILNPRTDLNLRLILNVTPSVVAGATTSTVRVVLLEMERVGGFTTDAIPFAA